MCTYSQQGSAVCSCLLTPQSSERNALKYLMVDSVTDDRLEMSGLRGHLTAQKKKGKKKKVFSNVLKGAISVGQISDNDSLEHTC